MYYVVYKITNKLNEMEYIGIHATEDLNDDYMGSGIYLRSAIRKHGRTNFKKEIIFVYDTAEEMLFKERELVTKEYVSRSDTYNLIVGGISYMDDRSSVSEKMKKRYKNIEERIKTGEAVKNSEAYKKSRKDPEFIKRLSEALLNSEKHKRVFASEEYRLKRSQIMKDSEKRKEIMASEEYKRTMSEALLSSEKHKKAKQSKEHREKIKELRKGDSYSKCFITEEHRELKRKQYTECKKELCIYCEAFMHPSLISRYHNENCKHKSKDLNE